MVSVLHNKKLLPGTMTDHVHQLINLISCKNIRVVSGRSAYVTPDQVIHLPPLPAEATDRDFLKYFCLGTHEQAHLYGKSDFSRVSKNKIIKGLQNVMEDIRCEELQEVEYPGLKSYRVQFMINLLEDFINSELFNASLSNIQAFVHTLGKYIIFKARFKQLDATHVNMFVSDELADAYDKYIADLESRIISMTTFDQADELANLIYDRLKDMIKENTKKNKPQPKQETSNDNSDQEDAGDNSEDDTEDRSEESSSPSDTDDEQSEDSSEEDGESTEDGNDQGDNESPEEDDSQSSDDSDGSDSSDEGDEVNETDSDQGQDSDSGDGDDSDSDARGEADQPVDESEEESDPELDREVERVLEELEENLGDIDVMSEIKEEINQAAEVAGDYMVDPSVKDIIELGRETTDVHATSIRDHGLRMLGPKASQLTKLFIQQTKPRTLHNRTKGTLDVLALANDVHDTRDDIYSNNQGAKLDKAAVTLLVDNSGSMSRRISDIYAILSGILMHLSRACIPTEAIGYTVAESCMSDKWRNIPAYLTIIKEFKESYGGKVMRRCTSPNFMGETNDLDGMRFAVPRLWARPEKKKVIMILCDGQPSMGNLTSVLSKSYKEYINICRKAGIIVFGIGIDANLKEYFGDDFVSVGTSDVGEALLTKLSQILNRKQV